MSAIRYVLKNGSKGLITGCSIYQVAIKILLHRYRERLDIDKTRAENERKSA